MKKFLRRFGPLVLAAVIASAPAVNVCAKARIAAAPPGVTVTKDGLVIDKAAARAGSSETTVLDSDDFWYERNEKTFPDPFVYNKDTAGERRFHGVRIGDEREIVSKKLGSAYTLINAVAGPGGTDFFEGDDKTRILWILYDENECVQQLVLQTPLQQ